LQTINTKLIAIISDEDRYFFKYLISEISHSLIRKYFGIEGVTYVNLERLDDALKSICEIEGYDYDDLEKLLKLKHTISLLKAQSDHIIKTTVIHYDWLLEQSSLDSLAGDLKSEKMISSVTEFKSLFTSSPIEVKINGIYKEYILILFDTLNEFGIIKARGRKGHFVPLIRKTVDFDNKILFKRKPNQIKYTIKKNTEKYRILRNKAEKRIRAIR